MAFLWFLVKDVSSLDNDSSLNLLKTSSVVNHECGNSLARVCPENLYRPSIRQRH